MVNRIFEKRHTAVGAKPGTLVIRKDADPTTIHLIEYSAEGVSEQDIDDASRLEEFLGKEKTLWIDVHGHGDENALRAIADLLKMHVLALEDVINVPQRPKVEPYDDHVLIVTRMVRMITEREIEAEQVSILVGANYVVTFQERSGDLFDPVRGRLRDPKSPFRSRGAGYLAYAILDAVIDGYYPVLEAFGEYLESLEDRIVESPNRGVLKEVHEIKRELLAIRRGIWPKREAINALIRDDLPFFADEVRVYLRDCYDHCVQIMDAVDTYREIAGGLMDVYLSSAGNRQNEIMKVLTIMASIFIPLSFLAGLYGMNFENMPELRSEWGYPMLLAVMVTIGVGMLYFFYRRGWLGGSNDKDG